MEDLPHLKKPWENEPEDPQVENANEVTFTAWIKCKVRADIKDNVSVNFNWLNANGGCSEPVDAGAAGTWEVRGTEGDDPDNPDSLLLHFEKSTAPLRCDPNFLRNFVEQQLRMTVTYPAPTPPPPEEGEEPAATPDPLQADIDLSLAPMMMLAEEIISEKLEISDLQCKQIQYDTGIMSFQVGIKMDQQMLSDEVSHCLNPVLVHVEYAKDLPEELQKNQKRDAVVASISVFGQKIDSAPSAITEDGHIRFNHYRCFFVGKWLQHQLREYIQTTNLQVEVHDRDGEEVDGETPAVFPHGRASFSLLDLLNPLITHHEMKMRADLMPVCRTTKERKNGIGDECLHASTLFTDEAKELLNMMVTREREYAPRHMPLYSDVVCTEDYTKDRYLPGGAYVEVSVRIAKPLPLPDVIMKKEEAALDITQPADGVEEEIKPDLTYERFGRIVLVLDYKKTTIVKKLLALITLHNTKVMKMEDGPSRAVATRQLTDAEKADLNLDILTGFIVMDRTTRIVLIEGLRSGGLNHVIETIGRPNANSKKWKMLHHPDVGFSERRYADFDLCLKQIKLRQQSLELLMQRPDLYDAKRTETDVSVTLQCLMEIKRAERMHILKAYGSFPTTKGLVTVETQYGDFVTDAELEGGCAEDDTKTEGSRSKASSGTQKKDRSQSTRSQPLDKTQLPDDDEDTASEDEEPPAAPMKKQRIIKKVKVDDQNRAFSRSLATRAQQQPEDKISTNKAMVRSASETLALNNPNKKNIDQSFLEGMPVHIYSGQKLCTTELQKAHLRAKMKEQEQSLMYTYSPEYNSGCFPMLDNCEGIEQQLRQVPADKDSAQHAEAWRYPKQRPIEDYRKPPIADVSDTRKWELRNENAPWQEGEWHGDKTTQCHTGITRGAFDSSSLGSHRHNAIIKIRRACLEPLPEQLIEAPEKDVDPQKATKLMENPPMKFPGRFKPARPNLVDKYFTQILDDGAQKHSLRFDKRRADKWLQRMEDNHQYPKGTAAKYGMGPETGIVETFPSSYQHHEEYHEEPRDSEHPFQLAKDCSRPVAPYGPGVLSSDKQRIYKNPKRTPLTVEETNGRKFQRPSNMNRIRSLPALR
eukprot:gnl/MRDRNA2_/MRDRNA2_102626_c0_seq1.p1 gnl/MRDRNA2_/MRDRNA2_102626_c0~~gnl/MRDRNA2_/MRDRNA2_102626_c0_seq1.p1  ORF type:complete len:1096 (-),score=238.69 gnl/MRDRNA2_/MRDRNA2_102626_c0_seq1:316-3603(-)